MSGEFREYRNCVLYRLPKDALLRLLRTEPEWRDKPEWYQRLIFLPTVRARQHTTLTQWTSRRGIIKQGQRKTLMEADVYRCNAGDYEVQLDEERVAVSRRLFETVFEPIQ
jgi:hypothetical protein